VVAAKWSIPWSNQAIPDHDKLRAPRRRADKKGVFTRSLSTCVHFDSIRLPISPVFSCLRLIYYPAASQSFSWSHRRVALGCGCGFCCACGDRVKCFRFKQST